jgi:hypothetical protein
MTVYETWEHRYGAELRQVVTVGGAPAGSKVVLLDEAKAELAEMREFYTETIQEQASDYLKACNIYEKRIVKLEQSLRDIIRHQFMMVGDAAKRSSVVAIARTALEEDT